MSQPFLGEITMFGGFYTSEEVERELVSTNEDSDFDTKEEPIDRIAIDQHFSTDDPR